MRTNTSTSITAIDSAAWDALDAGGSPFLRHAFLSSLESTGCVGAGTGWQPAPITLHDDKGLAAAAPAYMKAHSFGEFVFDFSWATASERPPIPSECPPGHALAISALHLEQHIQRVHLGDT